MIESAPAITIGTSVVTQDLTTLFPNIGTYGEIKVINAGPNPVLVTIGPDTHWLDLWAGDVFCLRGQTRVTFTPQLLQTPAPAAVPSSSLLLSVADRVNEIPGVYPTAVSRAVQSPQVVLAKIAIAGGEGSTSRVYAVPPGTHAIGLTADTPGVPAVSLLVYSNITGRYLWAQQQLPLSLMVPILSAVDTSISVVTDNTGGSALNIWVVAVFDALAVQAWVGGIGRPYGAPQNFSFASIIAGSGTLGIVGGVAGVKIRPKRLHLEIDAPGSASNSIELVGSVSGTILGHYSTNLAMVRDDNYDDTPMLSTGEGVNLVNAGAIALTARGHLVMDTI